MVMSKGKPLAVHLVTPEEPNCHAGKNETRAVADASVEKDKPSKDGSLFQSHNKVIVVVDQEDDDNESNSEGNFFMPSIRNTRELETEILETIHDLQKDESEKTEKIEPEHIINLLNRSITAISHWSLQAQLSQLRGNVDDRQLVETNLLRKEMEVLINRRSTGDEEELQDVQPKKVTSKKNPPKIGGYLRSPPYLPTVSSDPQSSPRRVTKKQTANQTAGASSISVDPVSLKLVENTKPHPRMRRTSDNPSTNEYVRVFHLQRK